MLNFFKNKINKQIVNIALTNRKTINNLLTVNKQNFITFNNNPFSTKFPSKNSEITKIILNKSFLKTNTKHFNSNSDSNDKEDKKASSGVTERRRLGKLKESTEEVLKKKIETLKSSEKTQKENEQAAKEETSEKKKEKANTANEASNLKKKINNDH